MRGRPHDRDGAWARWVRLHGIPALAAGAVLAPAAALGQAPNASLFTTEPRVASAASADALAGGPRRIGRVDHGLLGALSEEVLAGRDGKLRLNLFADVEYEASLERSAPTSRGYTLSGPLDDVPFGRAVLVVNNGKTYGRVYTPEGNWSIHTVGTMQTVEPLASGPMRCGLESKPVAEEALTRGGVASDVFGFDREGDDFRQALAPRASLALRAADAWRRPSESEPAEGIGTVRSSAPPEAGGASASGAAGASDDGVVDVLVAYPSFVREIEGGYGPLLALIDLDIATANEAFAASGVELRVRLAAAVEVEYDRFLEEDVLSRLGDTVDYLHWDAALRHLADPDDGHLDELHVLRDKHAADLVLLHLGGRAHERVAYSMRGPSGLAGLAFRVDRPSAAALEASGFSIALSGDGTVVAHELGHVMGLHHDRHDDRHNEPFPYSHGYQYRIPEIRTDGSEWLWGFGTIMATFSGRGQAHPGYVLAFSNPELVHPLDPGLRLGVPGDEPSDAVDGPADAARHLNEVRGTVANVRASADADPCGYELVGAPGDVPAGGGTFRLRVDTQPGCAWTAKAGEWVSITSNPEGEGSGEVTYRVSSNDHFKRSVEVMVAGRLHERSQAGSRPITPVCARSDRMVSAMMWRHPDFETSGGHSGFYSHTPCGALNFDADYLASIRTFHPDPGNPRRIWRGLELPELRAGDFDGLTGLYEIRINGVERIPPDVFAGMTGLRTVELSQELFWDDHSAVLGEIAPGAFRGVPGLMSIRVDGHRLRRLEAGVFEGLDGLLGLRFVRARAGSVALEPDVLEGLSDLRFLDLHNNGIGALDAGTFDGLTELRAVSLFGNEIRTLPTDVFDGLSRLRRLDLRDNRMEALPALDGLSALEMLLANANRISELESGVFDDLVNLKYLFLHYNRLARLAETALAPLGKLQILDLRHNRLTAIEPGTFAGLSELEILGLDGNRLTGLEAGTFDGLSSLELLLLANNGIRGIAPGAFGGLRVRYDLDLSNNRLGPLATGAFEGLWTLVLDLSNNRLGTLRAGPFQGHVSISSINLSQAGVTSFEPGAFEALSRVGHVWAAGNGIRELARGALRGIGWKGHFKLHHNPGAPFTFAPTPVVAGVAEGAVGQPLEIALEIASAAPVPVYVSLTASGGSLSADELLLARGDVRSRRRATVTPHGDGPVTVRIAGAPASSDGDPCESGVLIGPSARACFSGARLASGPPLVLYGIEDRSLVRGSRAEHIDLAEVFSYFVGTADYTVSTSDDAVAAVRVEDGTLTVTPGVIGTAEIMVTAKGMGGETLTRRFTVTVGVPSVPLFLSASNPEREGFVRVLSHSDRAGTVRVTAIDDAGRRHGPVRLRLRPYGATHFNSADLEDGNEEKRLLEGVGPGVGEGDWRLEFESDIDIEALSYVRTGDGFLTAIHDAAPFEDGAHRIATFNPASNVRQSSRLRVINTGREEAEVTVRGVDDAGASPGSPVRFSVPAGAAREFDAMQLEAGDMALDGALGDGEGKWRLAVESDSLVVAMSLLENASTGHLTNLSSAPPLPDDDGVHHVALFPAAGDAQGRQGFARVINRSQMAGVVRIDAFDDAGAVYGPLELAIEAGAAAHFNSDDLELGASGKGLAGSTGAGEGDWRLELSSNLDIEVLAYVRAEDGFLTTMHDRVAVRDGRREVVLLNPGSNADQASRLRLSNPLSEEALVAIVGTDDVGALPGSPVHVNVPARASMTLTAEELEAGIPHPDLEDYWTRWPLGDGHGKWRLSVVAEPGVLVQSLLESPTGHLTNLSSAPGPPGLEAN